MFKFKRKPICISQFPQHKIPILVEGPVHFLAFLPLLDADLRDGKRDPISALRFLDFHNV